MIRPSAPLWSTNNVFYACSRGVSLLSGYTEITDNVVLGENAAFAGFYVYENPNPPPFNTWANKIQRNKIFDTDHGIALLSGNALVSDNIIGGTSGDGIWVRSDYWKPDVMSLQRNIIKGHPTPIRIMKPNANIIRTDNYNQ